jgi:single-strand DNA-binding protein
MNKVILAGRLARDPEVRYTQDGKAVTSFPLAVNRRYSHKTEGQPTADFIPIVAWEKKAEACGNNLIKGSQVVIEGRMQIRNYDANDGTKRYVTEVIAHDIEFMGSRIQSNSSENSAESYFGPAIPDEDIPF